MRWYFPISVLGNVDTPLTSGGVVWGCPLPTSFPWNKRDIHSLKMRSVKGKLFSNCSLELWIFRRVTSVPVWALSIKVTREASIKTFKAAADVDEEVANMGDVQKLGIVVALMGPHSFNKFHRRVQRWTSMITDFSFFIFNAPRKQNRSSTTSSQMKANGSTADRLVCRESSFSRRSRWLLGDNFCCVSAVLSTARNPRQKLNWFSKTAP